jgi:hypothetical protein
LQQKRAALPEIAFSDLAKQAQKRFDIKVHPRTIERVLSRRQKKP